MFFSEHKKSLTPKEAALMTQLREDTKSKRIAARKSRVSLASFFVTELPVFFFLFSTAYYDVCFSFLQFNRDRQDGFHDIYG